MLKILLSIFLLVNTCIAKRVVFDWHLQYKNINPDGLFERRIISINDQWPPVPLQLNKNDILVINLYNQLNEPTVLHAHGIDQIYNTNTMDGAGMVTQCAIPSNYNFMYEFPVTQAGSFWIHSHFKVQYMDGLRVPLIVHDDENEPFNFDYEQIITVSDWYHQDSYTNLEEYMNHESLDGVEPIPQSGLINDHANTTFSLKPNKIYRLRIINISGLAAFNVYIDHHVMQVIEVDGVYTQPTTVSRINLAPGQRVSVLIKTKSNLDFNYLLHADMDPEFFDSIPEGLELNLTAPIYGKNTNFAAIPTSKKEQEEYDEAFIFPFHKSPALEPVARQINMTIDFMENTDGLNHGVINGIPYLPPLVPSLHTLLTIEPEYVDNVLVYGPQSNTHIFELDQIVELVINNLDDGPHPFHLHGHDFQVIARGSGVYKANDPLLNIPKNPTYRDTITVPSESYLVLRFKASNPGVWFFHCHIDWHLPAGLAATFITAPHIARHNLLPLPQSLIDVCVASGQPAFGNAAGKKGLDLTGAPDGIRPVQNVFLSGCIIATLVGLSTIIWHIWIDPGHENEDEIDKDKKPLLK